MIDSRIEKILNVDEKPGPFMFNELKPLFSCDDKKKGFELFSKGNINNFVCKKENIKANVKDKKEYHVVVEYTDNNHIHEVSKLSCDCDKPVSKDGYCRHIYSVLLMIDETLDENLIEGEFFKYLSYMEQLSNNFSYYCLHDPNKHNQKEVNIFSKNSRNVQSDFNKYATAFQYAKNKREKLISVVSLSILFDDFKANMKRLLYSTPKEKHNSSIIEKLNIIYNSDINSRNKD